MFVGGSIYFVSFSINAFGTSKKNDQVHFVCACVQGYEAVSLNCRTVQSVICNKDCIKWSVSLSLCVCEENVTITWIYSVCFSSFSNS